MSDLNNSRVDYIKVELAGIKLELECVCRQSFLFFRDYLSNFETPDSIISVTNDEINRKRETISYISDGHDSSIVADSSVIIENGILLEKIADLLPTRSALFMHGAVVEENGAAIMFTAPSGTGKSTRARIWMEEYPDSTVVNGDKPFIVISDENALACGTPWCGKEGWNTNAKVPLCAILLLERANEGDADKLEEIGWREAFPTLIKQTYCPLNSNLMRATIQLLKALEGTVRFYRFISAPTPEAIHLAHDVILSKV